MKKLLVVLLVLVSAVALIAEPEWLIENVAGGKKGGVLYLSALSDPKTLNVAWAQETSSTDMITWFLDTLLYSSNTGIADQPGMAKKFWKEETTNGISYFFQLRGGLKWSDGHDLTIDDVIFTFEKINFNPNMTANGNGAYLDSQERLPKIEKVGTDTVKFTYEEKFRQGYLMFGRAEIYPKHIFEKIVEDPSKFSQTWTVEQIDKVIASGPFMIKEYKPGVRIVFERNPYFYIKSKDGVQLPYLDQIIYLIVPDQNTTRLKFEAGDIDLLAPTATEFPSLKAQATAKKWITKVGGPALGAQFIAFNFNTEDPLKREVFRDPNFRVALSYAFDKQSIIDNLYNGLGEALYGPVTRSSGFYNKEVEKLGFRYSLATAKKILKEAGYTWNKEGKLLDKKGNPIKFELSTNAGNVVREEISSIFVDSCAKIGIDVTYRPINFNTLINNMNAGNYDSIVLGLTGGVDPGNGWNVWRLDGGLHFWNYSPEAGDQFAWAKDRDYKVSDYEKRIDEIYKLQAVTVDDAKLRALFDEFQILVAKNQVVIYTIAQNYLAVYKNTVHLFNENPSPAAGMLWKPWAIWKE
jgi:peptide/nickel transport system substrate-binding protein